MNLISEESIKILHLKYETQVHSRAGDGRVGWSRKLVPTSTKTSKKRTERSERAEARQKPNASRQLNEVH